MSAADVELAETPIRKRDKWGPNHSQSMNQTNLSSRQKKLKNPLKEAE